MTEIILVSNTQPVYNYEQLAKTENSINEMLLTICCANIISVKFFPPIPVYFCLFTLFETEKLKTPLTKPGLAINIYLIKH